MTGPDPYDELKQSRYRQMLADEKRVAWQIAGVVVLVAAVLWIVL